MRAAARIQAVAFTHEGAWRPDNEDTLALGAWVHSEPMPAPEAFELEVRAPLVCLVADGMGGHAAGEVASRAVAEYLVAQAARATDEAALAEVLNEAHAGLFALMREQPALTGMGTTVAGVAFTPQRVLVFNIGDSRVYGLENGVIEQLSTDDTPGPKLTDGRTAAYTTSLITQTLGGTRHFEPLEAHILTEPLRVGRGYLICSDGLSDLLDLPSLQAALRPDASASVQVLFDEAMARGGHDNISIIMLRISGSGEDGC